MATLRQLAHAQALARLRSFRSAAQVLHLSQPALTRSIRALEESLGVPLFDRLPGGVEPTAFGEQFLRKAASVLVAHDDLVRDMRLMAGLEDGALCVSVGPYPDDLLVPGVAATLAARHPGLAFRVRHGSWREVTAHVLAREADLGLAEISEARADDRLQTEPVGGHRLVVHCRAGHPLCAAPEVAFAHLASYPWVGTRVPARSVGMLGAFGGRPGTLDDGSGTFSPAWEVESVVTAKRIVAESDGLSAALLTQIERELMEGALVALPYQADWLRLDYGFVRLRDRTVSPAARAFMDEVHRQERALVAREAALRARFGLETARPRQGRRRA
jgi:DNA-binding transcriptional LysR family regulator